MLVKVYDQGLRRTELAKVSAQGLWMLEQGVDDRICVLQEFEAKPASPIYSPAAAAAASVAIMGHHRQVTISPARSICSGQHAGFTSTQLAGMESHLHTCKGLCHLFGSEVCFAIQADGLRDASGTSPPGSFEHEMLRFMQVQCRPGRVHCSNFSPRP